MTQDEFHEGWSKMTSLYKGGNDAYAATLWTKFGGKLAAVWFKAIDIMIEGRTDRFMPSVPEMYEYVRRANEVIGLSIEAHKCMKCGGDKFIPAPFIVRDQVIHEVRPCPTCNPNAKTEPSAIQRETYRESTQVDKSAMELQPGPSTVRFIRKCWPTLEIDWTRPEKDVLAEFMGLWRAGLLPKRKPTKAEELEAAQLLEHLKPAGPDQPALPKEFAAVDGAERESAAKSAAVGSSAPVTAVDESMPDDVREFLERQAEDEGIPF
jgi:hypothetical protein